MTKVKWVQKIKAVGFDVDGTLYRYTSEVSIALSREVARVAAELLGENIDEFAEKYLQVRDKYRSNTLALKSLGLDGEQIYQGVMDMFPLEEHAGKDIKLMKMVSTLKKKYRLFVITNGTGRQVERKISHLGIDYHDFDPRINCYDQGWVKPEPAPFLAAIESLNMKPEEIVYVGDRVDIDIEGAQAVGMKTIFVGGLSEKANASIESVYDIVSVL